MMYKLYDKSRGFQRAKEYPPKRPNTMPPRPNVPNPALAQIKALGDNFTKLQNDFDTFKGESEKRDKILLEKFKVLTSHNKALRARIDDLEEVSFDAEPGEGIIEDVNGVDGEQGAREVEMELSEEVKDAERSQEAADSMVVKVSIMSSAT
jgi:hypothetical protein